MLRKSTVVLFAFLLLGMQPLYAAEFFCPSGNVTCLIAAINEANLTSGPHTIFLEPGTYTVTTVDNVTDGPNGLPSIRTNLTIRQDDRQATIERDIFDRPDLACDGAFTPFRLFHVSPSGVLTLYGLGLRYGKATNTRDGGGAIFNRGVLRIERLAIYKNCTVDRDGTNMAPGGAIRSTLDARLAILDTAITDNDAQGPGGALSSSGFREVEIIRSGIFANRATVAGGIAANDITIRESSIYSNQGRDGLGGISATHLVLVNSTVARNIGRFPGVGGGILVGSQNALIINSTISENISAVGGGGIQVIPGGIAALQNVILAGNLLVGGFPSDCQGPVRSRGNNIIGTTTNCTIDTLESDIVGDPRLGEFTFVDGSASGHFPLLSDSPAIDSANPDACPEFDQIGNPRVDVCDRGAIEFRGEGGPGLGASPDTISTGGTVTVTWNGIPSPTPTDWIGIYEPINDDFAFIDWIYVSCSQTPNSPRADGSCPFPLSAAIVAGIYEFRLYANDGFTRLATSNRITVEDGR